MKKPPGIEDITVALTDKGYEVNIITPSPERLKLLQVQIKQELVLTMEGDQLLTHKLKFPVTVNVIKTNPK